MRCISKFFGYLEEKYWKWILGTKQISYNFKWRDTTEVMVLIVSDFSFLRIVSLFLQFKVGSEPMVTALAKHQNDVGGGTLEPLK